MYACQELGCDDAATMKVTAYMGGTLVGFNTKTATYPGTWPVDTLACSFSQGFDSVVVHYNSPPPTCGDYGVIFLADNMKATLASKAFGNNMKQMEAGKYAFYTGDFDRDENIDVMDAAPLETDINAFHFGYYASDTNGDGNVDLLDTPLIEENVNNFVYSVHP